MQIIIVGCGKVGYTLVEQLNGENHDIVVIDRNEEKVHSITNDLDAMGIVGNGVSYQTLLEAGITKADLLIAVTGSDEQNLLCCVIARKAGHCKTIARVRNPIYNTEIEFLRKELGLAMVMNPEMTSAAEIARIFQFPSAIKIDTFSKDQDPFYLTLRRLSMYGHKEKRGHYPQGRFHLPRRRYGSHCIHTSKGQ